MKTLNLFDGIGGFALAAEWAGFENYASCEIEPFCRRILDYWFNYKHVYEDIRRADFRILRGDVDIITGGFPCQPFSTAGKRRGTDDDRYLWPEMLRAIREVHPRWVMAENVRGLISQQEGVVFEQVLADLEDEGHEVQPFVLPACGVDAPHRRDRLWIVAHRADARAESVRERKDAIRASVDATDAERGGGDQLRDDLQPVVADGKRPDGDGDERDATDPAGVRRVAVEFRNRKPQETEDKRQSDTADSAQGWWRNFPAQSPVCRGNDGFSARLDGITFPKWRNASIKAYGNAIVPQVALQIFMAINEFENQLNTTE